MIDVQTAFVTKNCDGDLIDVVPAAVYERVVAAYEEKLRFQNRVLAAHVTVDEWERWKAETTV